MYAYVGGQEQADQWHDRLVETTQQYATMIRQVPPLVIALCFAVIPAVCEEWFFRGMLLRSLLDGRSARKAIIVSAVLFGAFHMISNSVVAVDRLIPTTLVGFALGYLAYKANSIWPGVILHTVHNAFVVFLAYYQQQLANLSWFPGEEESIPLLWVAVGAVIALLALTIVAMAKRSQNDYPESTATTSKTLAAE